MPELKRGFSWQDGHRPVLLVMRLCDMHRVHPGQDNSHVCERCGFQVGIYPSGQDMLKEHPDARILCSICGQVDKIKFDAGSYDPPSAQIIQEMKDSKEKK